MNDFIYVDIGRTSSFVVISKNNEALTREYQSSNLDEVAEIVFAFIQKLGIKDVYVDQYGFGAYILSRLAILSKNSKELKVHKVGSTKLGHLVGYIEKAVKGRCDNEHK